MKKTDLKLIPTIAESNEEMRRVMRYYEPSHMAAISFYAIRFLAVMIFTVGMEIAKAIRESAVTRNTP